VRLLLDTHIWLWSLLEPERLTAPVEGSLADPDAEIWLSPISVWETLVLAAKGRIRLDPSPVDWIDKQLLATPMRDAPLTRTVAVESRRVDLVHEDPADRFLAATAVVYDLVLVTADRRLMDCPSMQVLASR
jgi:PIN domain nuclease of toxin-antitoxin system